MARRELYHSISVGTALLAPAARTASANSSSVDTAGYYSTTLLVVPGTLTDGTFALALQESDDNSTFTAVATGDMIGSLANIASNTIQKVGYIGSKRYVRIAVTVTGSPATGAVFGILAILGHAAHKPAANP